ncbi:histone H2A-Bbd type 2/3 isoform X2 [Zalophus californianus]|uniref:Histone H2A n=1 Tax=Zalophus californianus TaxID=9704 RepID=A0A6J2EBH8_ZALCA|nr:histone H2A-Bbd type 2/3-like [Zalophus californianus]XP_035581443.1 histone H2A-Bbd type 2/3 isoform X2 [Zalophus californianus]
MKTRVLSESSPTPKATDWSYDPISRRRRRRGPSTRWLEKLGPAGAPHRTAPHRTAPHRTAELGPSEKAQSRPSMPGKRSRRASSSGRRRTRSRTARAELSFSVSLVERLLREGHYARRLGSSAPVFLAAVIQYLTAMVLELAGNEAQNSGRSRITPELVDMAIHNNALLSGFLGTTTISQVAPDWD